jgi:hypothetical protein
MNVYMNFKLYDYVLFVDGTNTGEVTKLGMFEAQKINYAYALNKSNRRYVRKSDIDVAKSDDRFILLLPED